MRYQDARGAMTLIAVVSGTVAIVSFFADAGSPSRTASAAEAPSRRSAAAAVRERRIVVVNGKSETWELQWMSAPIAACPPEDPGWFTCPCEGFAFGESGDLDLVRLRDGKEIDRLRLTPVFSDHETPAAAGETKAAVLQRWPVLESDLKTSVDADSAGPAQVTRFKQEVMRRKPVSILEVADFNRDGWPTEFVLQVGVLPCGKMESVLVGLSPARPRLHLFGTAEHPDTPLVLYPDHWLKLRTTATPVRVVSWACGDHASEQQTELTLSLDKAGIHVVREDFSCEAGKEHGELLSRERL